MARGQEQQRTAPILGGYELIGKIGKGGMGNVFKARQVSMDRIVALKILPTSLARDTKFVERFHREAKAAAKLSHMNIIQSIDVGEEDGYHYFAMEYVQGPTMEDLLQKSPILKEDFCLHVIIQMARAIQAAEKLHMVHLDIKPSNIMITRDRVAKLADFGVARHVAEMDSTQKQSLVFGTPEYMSPEQALGRADLDSRSDIYSLGVSFYQMVTGRLPFEGASAREIVDKRLQVEPVPPKQLNSALSDETCTIIEKMLKRNREERYQNATELIEDLEYVSNLRRGSPGAIAAAQMPIELPPEELGAITGTYAFRRRRRSPVGALVGLLVLVLAIVAAFWIVKNRPDIVERIQVSLGLKEEPRPAPVVSPESRPPEEPPQAIPQPPTRVLGATPGRTSPSRQPKKRRSHPVAQRSYSEVKEMIKGPVAAGNYLEAMEIIDTFPLGYRQYPEWEELVKLKEDLKSKMQSRFQEDKVLVERLASARKFVEAMDLCDEMKQRYPDEMKAEIEQKQLQIQALQESNEERQLALQMAALQTFRDSAGAMFAAAKQGNYDQATQMLQEASRDPANSVIRPIIERLHNDMTLLKDYVQAVRAGLDQSMGKSLVIEGIAGVLTGVEGNTLQLKASGQDLTKPISDLGPQKLNSLAESGGYLSKHKVGELHLGCALFYFFHEKIEDALVEFKKARDAGVDTGPYMQLLRGQ